MNKINIITELLLLIVVVLAIFMDRYEICNVALLLLIYWKIKGWLIWKYKRVCMLDLKDIKNIVTKEQFEACKYVVERNK